MADLTTFMCRLSLKSDSLNLQEPSGPVEELVYLTLDVTVKLTSERRVDMNAPRIRNIFAASAFHAMLIFIIAQYKNAYGRCEVLFSLIQLANQTCSTN